MCTYDYTPYTGCEDGHQHYYIQWVKCNTAVEKGRYCSVEASHRVEQLRKLSSNVLSCPLHGPIAVQQFVLDSVNARPQDDSDAERSRARSTTRRAATSRGRTPKRGSSDRELEQVPREVRKRRPRREIVVDSSDSESSTSPATRPRGAGRARALGDGGVIEGQRSRATRSHRRSISADVAPPPPPALSMRHGRSEVSLPLKTDFDEPGEVPSIPGTHTRPNNSLDIPRAVGVVGLPSSPDMHRRGSVHRTRSEGLLRRGSADGQLEPAQPVPRSTVSPSCDSSPDHNPELPFSNPARRGRRAGARSIRDRSVDTTMRRIDEHIVPDDSDRNIGPARDTATPERRGSATTTSPEPQHHPIGTTYHRRSGSRPRLNTLQIPQTHPQYQRDAYSAPTATPPETDITHRPSQSGAKSLRHVDMSSYSAVEPLPLRNEDTASIRSTRSRRLEDQFAEGRRWAAAREHLPPAARGGNNAMTDVLTHMSSETNLVSNVGPIPRRESADSGYRSGHQPQRSWESIAPSVPAAAAAGKVGRNTLQKSPPQGQSQAQVLNQTQGQAQGQGAKQRHTPAPLDLRAARLPPCALPVSLLSPGVQSDMEVGAGGKGGKGLLQRMGLRKKFSGLLWDRGGQREVGVEG